VLLASTVASSFDGVRLACLADSRAHAWVGTSDCRLGVLDSGSLIPEFFPF
jgi:hypothetical protein